jgi:hypothetical protein
MKKNQSSHSIKDLYNSVQEWSTLLEKHMHQARLIAILAWRLPPA